jgi:NitT/TauT family transport system substrate-binding protein
VEKGTPAFLLLQYIAAEKGLTLADFDMQYMPVADAATAFIAGKVDAAGTYEPYITNAIKAVQ